jgi:hypothetical protein
MGKSYIFTPPKNIAIDERSVGETSFLFPAGSSMGQDFAGGKKLKKTMICQ